MKVWEINLEENKQYEVVGVSDKCFEGKIFTPDRFGDLNTQDCRTISELCTLRELLDLEFEEVIDWSKIPIDTKVLVSNDGEKWRKRYFKEVRDNLFVCFVLGRTSWSANLSGKEINEWEYCKLAQD